MPEQYRGLRSFAFGDGPALADELLDLVMKGIKTATCRTEDEPNTSTPGERWVVLDGRGAPRCVIETTEVTYRRFGEVDAAFAYEEGEGDRSLDYWRDAHRNYFGRQGKFREDMMLMCERFRLVEVFEDHGDIMKFTLSWLKEHLDTDEPLDKLADKLTMIGLEVESIDDKAKALAPFSIARVISAEQHPNADRLRVCMVDTGDGGAPVQVVCGAPNARAGLISVFSPPGTFIPGKNITLGVGTISGVESRGMLCSAAELQISEDHDGIMELPADAPVGKGYAEWAGLGDPVIEINLTPNRQDCTGVHGIARDLSAADMGKFKDPAIKPVKGEFPCPVKVTVEDDKLCPGFALRLVRGVKNGPSPEWLQKRLTSIGLRPINALVDITNFMTYDRARPLHVFDAKKVNGNLTVRRARDGESLLALDGRTYNLDPSICVIADEHGVELLAGIMGGETSGCDENTTDVLIESALWNEINIAQTGRKLGINSDARYRFERGVDPAFMVPGLELATKLVMEMCGGTPSENVVVGNPFGADRIIDFPLSEVKRLAGIEVPLVESQAHPRPSRLHGGRQRPRGEGRGALLAHRRVRARPTSSRRSCASSASTRCR